jgi:hypothetical protein
MGQSSAFVMPARQQHYATRLDQLLKSGVITSVRLFRLFRLQ